MKPKKKTLQVIKMFCIFTGINYKELLPIKTEEDAQEIIETFNNPLKKENKECVN